MHDPWQFSLSKTPISARSPIMLYLQKQQIKHSKFKNDIISLKKFVEQSNMNEMPDDPETGESLHKKLRQTDLYRNQNFAISHSKIAKVIKYEL
jgi:DNA/RNA endonuclease G (NUC1)